jgi:hypothetical protein
MIAGILTRQIQDLGKRPTAGLRLHFVADVADLRYDTIRSA